MNNSSVFCRDFSTEFIRHGSSRTICMIGLFRLGKGWVEKRRRIWMAVAGNVFFLLFFRTVYQYHSSVTVFLIEGCFSLLSTSIIVRRRFFSPKAWLIDCCCGILVFFLREGRREGGKGGRGEGKEGVEVAIVRSFTAYFLSLLLFCGTDYLNGCCLRWDNRSFTYYRKQHKRNQKVPLALVVCGAVGVTDHD